MKISHATRVTNWKRLGCFTTALTLSVTATACTGTAPAPEASSAPAAPSSSAPETPAPAPAGKPNVVYIVMDDMGYSDLGCYGSSISTPNIDALAKAGIIYSDYYTQPMSSPSRASMLTGCESNQIGMGIISDVDFGEAVPNIHGRVYPEHGTLADSLVTQGYETMAVGKWHLGPFPEFVPGGDKEHWPSGKGFNQNYCFIGSQANQFQPGSMISGNQYVEADFSATDYHFTQDMVDTSLEMIDNAKDNPFFLYFATGALHGPLQAPQAYIDKYKGKFDHGWDVEREQRLAKQIEKGLLPAGTVLPPANEGVKAWADLTDVEKQVSAKHMEVYAGFLEHTDAEIGRLMEELKKRGEFDNTIFALVSDNGSNSTGAADGNPMAHMVENVMTVKAEDQLAHLDEMGGAIWGSQYNKAWAMASETPFRYNKTNTFNGGVRVPLIVSYVDGIKEPGRISNEIVDSMDITPTILDVIGVDQVMEVDGLAQHPMQGSSFKQTLDSAAPVSGRDKTMCFILGNNYSYSDGEYYLASHPITGKPELYHMANDPTQITNLAETEPEKFAELFTAFEEKKREYGAENLLIDMMHGIKPEVIVQRYGDVGKEVLTCLQTKTPPTTPEAGMWLQMLQAFTFDPGAGYPGVGVTLYDAPGSPHAEKDYTYDPADGMFFSEAAAPTTFISHTIDMSVEAPENPEGVIFARGGIDGGYSFYIKDGKLVYEYNFCDERIKLTSEKPVPAGKVDIEFIYDKEGLFDGKGTLKMNGEVVAQGAMKELPIFVSFDYVSFGEDAGSLVSKDYTRDFKFNGKVGPVNMHLGDDLWSY